VLILVEEDSKEKADLEEKEGSEKKEEENGRVDDRGLGMFAGRVPVPMEWPGRAMFYGGEPPADGRGPWFYQQG
jgi:hypothetical protein